MALVAVSWLAAELAGQWALRRLRTGRHLAARVVRWHHYLRWSLTGLLLAGYAGLVYGLDWPTVVRRCWGLDGWVLVDEALILSPLLAALVLAGVVHLLADDRLRRLAAGAGLQCPRRGSWRACLAFVWRFHLGVVLVPLAVLVTLDDLVCVAVADSALRQWLQVVSGLAGVVAVVVLAPVLLRLLWRAEPLPDSGLRRRLQALSGRLRFRASDILVWRSRGLVINAAVAGVLPWPRYVLLSDGLVENLSEGEIEAVFGHEVGHVRHHHLGFYLAFFQSAALFLLVGISVAGRWLAGGLPEPPTGRLPGLAEQVIVPFGGVSLYLGLVFGFLSRRLEREADIYGCRAVSCGRADCPPHDEPGVGQGVAERLCPTGIRTFVAALEKIAWLSGSVRDLPSWRHFSVARRVAFLERLIAEPALEQRFRHRVRVLKTAVLAAAAAAVVLTWWLCPGLIGWVSSGL